MNQESHLDGIARQVESAAQMEMAVNLDVIPGDKLVDIARLVHESLTVRLRSAIDEGKNSAGMNPSAKRASVRTALISEINRLSLRLINDAIVGLRKFNAAKVEYLTGAKHPTQSTILMPVAFDELPAISGRDKVLETVLRIRAQPALKQMGAALMLETRWLFEGFELLNELKTHHSLPIDALHEERRARLLTVVSKLKLTLPAQLLEDAELFYGTLRSGSIDHWAIPIDVSRNASPSDLRFVAELFRIFGEALKIPCELHLRGAVAEMAAAESGRTMYEGAGVAFKVLSAWLMAAGVIDNRSKCSICYRHCSAISRCSIHATKQHETRDARLAKEIWPHYVSLFNALSQDKFIHQMLGGRLSWSDHASDAMLQAARNTEISPESLRKAIVLANQLRELAVVMNLAMLCEVEALFSDVLHAVRSVEQLPKPTGDMEKYARQRQNHAAKELLSLKGFFRAWWGSGRYSPEIDLKMRGIDRDHPVARGSALASIDVPRALLEERAWRDAEQEFKRVKLPTSNEVNRYLKSGLSKTQIASDLGIALSTVYRILERGRKRRKRNFLGWSKRP